jgi:hypothetical protein
VITKMPGAHRHADMRDNVIRGPLGVNVNVLYWASQTLLKNSRYAAYATRCVRKYRVHLIAPTASGNV